MLNELTSGTKFRAAEASKGAWAQSNVAVATGTYNHRIKITSPAPRSIDASCPWQVLNPDLTVAAEGVADTHAEAVEAVLAKWKELGFTL